MGGNGGHQEDPSRVGDRQTAGTESQVAPEDANKAKVTLLAESVL